MNLGLVGIGRWGKNLLRVFDALATVDTVCHTGSVENRRWLDEHYPAVSVTADPEQLYARPEIDAVAIATPIDTHYALAKRAMLAGKDVFVEKPLAADRDEATELQRIASQEDRVLFVGYIFVYHPLLQPIYELGRDGGVTKVRFDWQTFGDFSEDLLLEFLCHPVSIVTHLCGSVLNDVTSREEISVSERRDAFSASFGCNGTRVQIGLNRFSPHDTKQLVARSADGRTYVWDDTGLYRTASSDEKLRKVRSLEREPLAVECERFVEAVEGERGGYPTDGEFGVEVNRLVERLRDAD